MRETQAMLKTSDGLATSTQVRGRVFTRSRLGRLVMHLWRGVWSRAWKL